MSWVVFIYLLPQRRRSASLWLSLFPHRFCTQTYQAKLTVLNSNTILYGGLYGLYVNRWWVIQFFARLKPECRTAHLLHFVLLRNILIYLLVWHIPIVETKKLRQTIIGLELRCAQNPSAHLFEAQTPPCLLCLAFASVFIRIYLNKVWDSSALSPG